MPTRSEAKLAIWEASDKSDEARAFLADIMKHSIDKPHGEVSQTTVDSAVRNVPGAKKPTKHATKKGASE